MSVEGVGGLRHTVTYGKNGRESPVGKGRNFDVSSQDRNNDQIVRGNQQLSDIVWGTNQAAIESVASSQEKYQNSDDGPGKGEYAHATRTYEQRENEPPQVGGGLNVMG